MPENTIPAMIKALQVGVTTLEMDAHITQDSLVVISHDPFMNSDISTKPDGSPVTPNQQKDFIIYRMNYSEIRRWYASLAALPAWQKTLADSAAMSAAA